jgi:hypothetical protein
MERVKKASTNGCARCGGQKGELSEGWQAVRIVPPTEPMDRFLDQIKQTKIVKAVRVSRR